MAGAQRHGDVRIERQLFLQGAVLCLEARKRGAAGHGQYKHDPRRESAFLISF